MSLLFLNGQDEVKQLSKDTYHDLAVEELVDIMAVLDVDKEILKNVLSCVPLNQSNVQYRQEIIKDFIYNKELCQDMDAILKKLNILRDFKEHGHYPKMQRPSIKDLIDYMQEMEVYIQIIEDLNNLFSKHKVESKGLLELSELLKKVVDSDKIAELKKIVSELNADVSTLKSVTVGINLSMDMRPEEIFVLGYSHSPFHSKFDKIAHGLSIKARRIIRYREPSQFMQYICDDVEKELGKMTKEYKKQLRNYINLDGYFLLDICDDLRFYLIVADYARQLMDAGNSICFPKINLEGNSVEIKGVYNLRLTKKEVDKIVKNDFSFSDEEKLFILTGPNRGGKTMLTQAVGMSALLAMQGLFVPADSYEGFIFEDILTHFPADENSTLDLGRLGEEAARIQQIVKNANSRTLILLNETYSSTSAYDGLYLSKDLMHVLKHKGVPTLFNTHIHELARSTGEMNQWEGTSDIVSLTMEIVDNVNTFRVLRSEPNSSSFAKNIALKYGVTYEQMMAG